MAQTMNINQFKQAPIKGGLDLAITGSKTISGVVSASQSTALVPGQRVKLDTAAQNFLLSFVAAGDNEAAFGTVIYNARNSANLEAGQPVEVAGAFGPFMWCEAGSTFAAGDTVYQTGTTVDSTSGTHKKVGIALDGASASGDLCRIMLVEPQSLGA